MDLIEGHVGARVLAAASAEEALLKVRDEHIDLILTDLGLPGAAGADAITLYRHACDAVIVVLSASESRQEIGAATRAGAAAVVSKSVGMGTLREVVGQALSNSLPDEKWIRSAGSLAVVGDDPSRRLTCRQQEVASLLMNGHSNKEIGLQVGLAEITVKTHLTAIFRRLGVGTRTQAVLAIRKLGIAGWP